MMMKRALMAAVTLFAFSATTQAYTTSKNNNDTALLFVQAAKSATLTPVDTKKGVYNLKLQEAEPFVSYFTEAPKRAAGQMQLKEFYSNWSKGNKTNPGFIPNAAMQSIDSTTKQQVNRVFELTAPNYDAKSHTVTYKATLIGEEGLPTKAITLGRTELFIDDFHWGGNKFHSSTGS